MVAPNPAQSSPKAHICQNNEGIFLLKRQCFLQAFAKFKQALQSIEKDFHGIRTQHQLREKMTLEPYPHPIKAKFYTLVMQGNLPTADEILSLLHANDRSDSVTQESIILVRLGTQYNVVPSTNVTLRSHNTARAAILYNIAMAHQIYAKALQVRRPQACNVQNQQALRAFEKADSLTKGMVNASSKAVARGDADVILFIRMLALLGMYESQVSSSNSASKRRLEKKLARVYAQLKVEEQEGCKQADFEDPAAVAD